MMAHTVKVCVGVRLRHAFDMKKTTTYINDKCSQGYYLSDSIWPNGVGGKLIFFGSHGMTRFFSFSPSLNDGRCMDRFDPQIPLFFYPRTFISPASNRVCVL
jgi:hypothetical protein